MPKIQFNPDTSLFEALIRSAAIDRRRPADQAVVLLERALMQPETQRTLNGAVRDA